MTKPAIIVSIVVMISSPIVADNLLVNPNFDDPDQLDGWTCTTNYGTAVWSPEDLAGSIGSGSMEHHVAAGSDNQSVRCSQCVAVNEFWDYFASVWFFWPDDPDVFQVGSTRIAFQFYSDASCMTIVPGGEVQIEYPVLDTWIHLVSDVVTAPAGAAFAGVFVFTWQNNANEPVRARLDDVVFKDTSLFRDNFDSGNVNGWSSSVP